MGGVHCWQPVGPDRPPVWHGDAPPSSALGTQMFEHLTCCYSLLLSCLFSGSVVWCWCTRSLQRRASPPHAGACMSSRMASRLATRCTSTGAAWGGSSGAVARGAACMLWSATEHAAALIICCDYPPPGCRMSSYLFGRERRVADVPTDHPSCSKQHAVLQFRWGMPAGQCQLTSHASVCAWPFSKWCPCLLCCCAG